MKAISSAFSTWLRRGGWVVALMALVQLSLHLYVNARDGIFRDELYYLAAAQHPDLGYVDFPPLVMVAAGLGRALFGTSVLGIRLLPALSGALLVFVTAALAAELGGKLHAQALAAAAVAFGPVFIAASGLLTMDPFDQLWWALLAWALVRLIRRQEPRLWLLFGVIAGLGLLNKVTVAFFGFALIVGLLASPSRRLLFNRWLVLGGLLALVIFSPYILWNVQHGFPTVEFWKTYANGKTYPVTPLEFLFQQVQTTNPLAVPLWLAGLYAFFFTPPGKPYRALGWAYLILYGLFTLQKAKFYFLTPAYPMLFAGGAVFIEDWLASRPRWRWSLPVYAQVLLVSGLLVVPMSLPILSPQAYLAYSGLFGSFRSAKQENDLEGIMPQNYADRYGWPQVAGLVAQAYHRLTPEEQAEVCILTHNYGQAGAVDYFGPALGLPKAISGHNSYYLWGPRGCTGKVIIAYGYPLMDLVFSFESFENAGQLDCPYCMPHENGWSVYILRGLKVKMSEAWPTTKWFQ